MGNMSDDTIHSETAPDIYSYITMETQAICKSKGVRCEYATAYGYCQIIACVKQKNQENLLDSIIASLRNKPLDNE